jgi:hypothetical protein
MAEPSKAPAKRDHRFDFLHFIAMMFAVLLIGDLWRLVSPMTNAEECEPSLNTFAGAP